MHTHTEDMRGKGHNKTTNMSSGCQLPTKFILEAALHNLQDVISAQVEWNEMSSETLAQIWIDIKTGLLYRTTGFEHTLKR